MDLRPRNLTSTLSLLQDLSLGSPWPPATHGETRSLCLQCRPSLTSTWPSMLQKWKLRLKKGQSHAPKETGDERGPTPKCQKVGADDLRMGVGTIAPLRTFACGLLHDSDRETEADQCLTIYMGIGGFHGDVYLLHRGIWECGRTGVIWKAGRCRPRSL